MRAPAEHAEINRMLGSHGLGSLEDGAGLMVALAFMVQDHEHLRSLLARCPPEDRRAMYDSLAANLRFKAHPLDTYMAETARLAERQQLPTLDPDGNLKPFKSAPEVVSAEVEIAQAAVDKSCGTYHLVLTCAKCTRTDTFSGYRKADAIQLAREMGWIYYELQQGQGRECCPKCLA